MIIIITHAVYTYSLYLLSEMSVSYIHTPTSKDNINITSSGKKTVYIIIIQIVNDLLSFLKHMHDPVNNAIYDIVSMDQHGSYYCL